MSTLISILTAIGLSLEVGLIFFYKALWSILFGVAVTAAIDVFVDKDRMARFLGGRNVKTTGLATVVGAVSSACTFGAVTIAQTLFKKGSSAEATFAFAPASTNIVFELAILIYVLLGPAFVAAELLSGVVLVAIMYLLVRATLPVGVFEQPDVACKSRRANSSSSMPGSSNGGSSFRRSPAGTTSPRATSARSSASTEA